MAYGARGAQEERQAYLNRLAGTTKLEAAGAANVLAGTTGLELVGALNRIAGTTGLGREAAFAALAAAGGPVAITDTFSEADGTNLHGKATTTGGKTWTVQNGTLDINTGKARVTAGSGSSWATITSTANIDMSVTVTIGATTIDGAMFRVTDTSNYWRVDLNAGGSPGIALIKNVAGSESTLTTASFALSVGNTNVLRVVANGTTLRVYWAGTLRIDTTDATHQSATKHGIIGFSTNTRFDDFSLVDL